MWGHIFLKFCSENENFVKTIGFMIFLWVPQELLKTRPINHVLVFLSNYIQKVIVACRTWGETFSQAPPSSFFYSQPSPHEILTIIAWAIPWAGLIRSFIIFSVPEKLIWKSYRHFCFPDIFFGNQLSMWGKANWSYPNISIIDWNKLYQSALEL